MFDLISVGDSALDAFLTLDEKEASVKCKVKKEDCEICFNYGSKIPVEALDFSLGGNAPNVSVGLKRLGFNVGLYTIHGDDIVGRIADEKIEAEGLSREFIFKQPGQTSYSTIINYQTERTILAKKQHRDYKIFDNFPKAPYMYISSLGPDFKDFYKDISKFVADHKVKLGFNPAPAELRGDFSYYEGVVRAANFVFVNKEEAGQMLGKQQLIIDNGELIKEMLAKIAQFGPRYVVITVGVEGAYVFDSDKFYYCGIFPVKRVEATGAGDAFASGFMGAIMDGKNTIEAMRWGMVNSAAVVTKVGAIAGLLSKEQIENMLQSKPDFGPKEI